MIRSLKFAVIATLAVALLAAAPFPAAAQSAPFPPMSGDPGAVFYELTESMKLISRKNTGLRVATSALRGTADRGTPFCPDALLANFIHPDPILQAAVRAATFCDLVAIGSDRIDTATGLGTFKAKIDIIIPGDNDTDGPELVIGTIKVRGDMDFSPAFSTPPLPFGTIRGKVHANRPGRRALFSGTFRLPFKVGGTLLYLDTIDGQPRGVIPIQQPGELSLMFPLVRFEVWFAAAAVEDVLVPDVDN